MIALLSPAKSLDFEKNEQIGVGQPPYFLEDAEKINRKLRKVSRRKLMKLQSISSQLAELNFHRNQDWNIDHTVGTKQAILAFKGDVYIGLQADQWSEEDMSFALDHIRILSGLYGLLKPNDLIKPYRLEMGTSLPVGRRKDLYHFWGDKLKAYVKNNMGEDELILNMASNEYFKAFKSARLKNPVIDFEFKDFSNGEFKMIGFFAKKARGMMANYMVQHRITQPEALKSFDVDGYYFDDKSSTERKFVFLRDQDSKK